MTHVPPGATAGQDDSSAVTPRFAANVAGAYVAQLIVEDADGRSAADTALIATGDVAPRADAGADQSVARNDLVQLDGGGQALTYRWAFVLKPHNSNAQLSDPNAAAPSFTADRNGAYIIQLIVSDGTRESRPDAVTVSTDTSRPVVDAGADQLVFRNPLVTLDGTGSVDADGDPLSHDWSLLRQPPGAAVVLSDPGSATPDFVADTPGTYVAQLLVDDGALLGRPDSVLVTVVNRAPVADAGPDQALTSGVTVALDGATSADGDALSYAWTLTDAPAGALAVFTGTDTATPSLLADMPGSYTATLTVSDGIAASLDTVTVTASAPPANVAPTLLPVGDRTLALGTSLSLTLQGSDPNGDAIAYSVSTLPLPASAGLDGQSGAFTFTPDEAQVGDITLTFLADDGLLTTG